MRKTVGILLVASFLCLTARSPVANACGFAHGAKPACAAESISHAASITPPNVTLATAPKLHLQQRAGAHLRTERYTQVKRIRTFHPAGPGTWMKRLDHYIHPFAAMKDA